MALILFSGTVKTNITRKIIYIGTSKLEANCTLSTSDAQGNTQNTYKRETTIIREFQTIQQVGFILNSAIIEYNFP